MRCLRFVACSLCLLGALPMAALADGSPSGFPLCSVAGDQLAPSSLPRYFAGFVGSRGAMVFWQDLRGYPNDPGDLWYADLDQPFVSDIRPVDGLPAVQRPGEQSQPAATMVWSDPPACQWCGVESLVLAYADADGLSANRSVRARGTYGWPGAQWDVPVSVSTLDSFDPIAVGDRAIYAGSASGALVAWLEADAGGATRLRVQHVAADGSRLWGDTGLPVVTDASGQSDARMIADGANGAYFAWTDSRHGDDLAIYAMRLADNGSPAPGWPASGMLVRTSAALPQSASIVPDGAGGIIVLWHELETLSDLSHGLQPRVLRILGNGSLAPGWPAAGLRVVVRDDVPLYVNDLKFDGVGGVFAAMTAVAPTESRIVVQRVLADGTRPPGWPSAGLEACVATGSEGEPRLSAEGGVASVVWRDDRAGATESDIYAARFLPDGSRLNGWPEGGLVVGQAQAIQRTPIVAPGMYGGVVIAWADSRNLGSTGWDIYGQTVTADGRLDVSESAPPRVTELAYLGEQPTRGTARFRLGLATAGRVTADVYDVTGRRLARLVDGMRDAGWLTLSWSPGDEGAGAAAPGVRFLRVRTESGERTLRFVTLR